MSDPWLHHGPGPELDEHELRLRPPREEDLPLAVAWWSDEAVCFGFQCEPRSAEEVAEGWHETPAEARSRGEIEVTWVIEADGRAVGLLWLSLWALDRGDADLSVLIGDPGYRGRGLGPRAVRLAASWTFNSLPLTRLWICPRADHNAAIAAYEKAGCVEDGLEPRAQTWRGQEVWTLRMVLTRAGLESAARAADP